MTAEQSLTERAVLHLVSEAGLALLDCQVFEASLRVLLCFLEEAGAIATGAGSGDDLMERLDTWTAGRLAALLREHAGIADADGVIAQAVAARNRIVHRFFLEHAPIPPFSADDYTEALDQLDSLRSTIERADVLVAPHLHRLGGDLYGIDPAAIERSVRRGLSGPPHA